MTGRPYVYKPSTGHPFCGHPCNQSFSLLFSLQTYLKTLFAFASYRLRRQSVRDHPGRCTVGIRKYRLQQFQAFLLLWLLDHQCLFLPSLFHDHFRWDRACPFVHSRRYQRLISSVASALFAWRNSKSLVRTSIIISICKVNVDHFHMGMYVFKPARHCFGQLKLERHDVKIKASYYQVDMTIHT